MDFGRLKNIENTDFTLPGDYTGNKNILNGTPALHPAIYVGCPVWADKGFIGKIYPEDAQEKYFLRYYAQQFNCIELNATRYKIPTIETVGRWKSMVTTGFRFCPKVPQVISHANSLMDMTGLMKEFIHSINHFEETLGTTFLQLSPYFTTSRLSELISFLGKLPHKLKLAVELRHESWFTDKKVFDELCSYLTTHNYSLVITDVPGRRDVLHQRLTNSSTFIRFGGNNLHPTDFTRLNDWAKFCTTWVNEGLEEIYFFVHSPQKSFSAELANHFISQFNKANKIKVTPVKIKKENKQGSLFE